MDKKYKNKPFAKKSLGQNFLIDPNYIRKIIDAVNPQMDDTIIEIGTGRGALTEALLENAGKLIAVEIDDDLIPLIIEDFGSSEKFRLVHSDALTVDFTELIGRNRKAKLAANLPYYISTAILQHLIEHRESFSEMVLMLQKEVVERITAQPGNKERGFLTVLLEAYFESRVLFDVPPNAFRPAPKIWSSVIRIIPKQINDVLLKESALFKKIIGRGFAQKRKTLNNNLKNSSDFTDSRNLLEILQEIEIDGMRRAESLTLDEWVTLTRAIAESS